MRAAAPMPRIRKMAAVTNRAINAIRFDTNTVRYSTAATAQKAATAAARRAQVGTDVR